MIAQAVAIADRLGMAAPVVEQPEYSLLRRDRVEVEYFPLYISSHGLGTTVYSPLAMGFLTGKYNDGIPDGSRFTVADYAHLKNRTLDGSRFESWETLVPKIRQLAELAESMGATPAQLALAWCLKNEHVSTVIMGATSVSQLHENVAALTFIPRMRPQIMKQINAILGSTTSSADAVKDFVGEQLTSLGL